VRLGFVGLGTMGAAMAANLLRAGHSLTIWNRTPGRAPALLEAGAVEASDPAGVAAASEVVVICVSDTLADAIRAIGVVNVQVIPSGVDIPPAIVAPDEPPFALFVGRLSDEKGVDVLADATRDLPLVVVGDGPRRDLFPGALGFLPPSAVHGWYDRASVIVLPSRREGLGNVLLEAMAHGRPVIGTDVGGIPSVVEHGRNGLLIPSDDPDALRGALTQLLADPDLRSRLGSAGRELVRARASWESVTARTLAVYREAVEQRPVRSRGWRPVLHRV